MSKEYEIVVAHYNEDLSWLKGFSKDSLRIYSKGNHTNINGIKESLPNVGREAHTYLYYIIQNYDNLPDIVFFTQGNISDHKYTISDIHNKFINLYKNQICSNNYSNNINDGILKRNHIFEYLGVKLVPFKMGFFNFFKTYITDNHRFTEFKIYYRAIFSVRKEAILSRSKEYYKTLLELLSYDNNPEVGHFMERSWYYIFNLDR